MKAKPKPRRGGRNSSARYFRRDPLISLEYAEWKKISEAEYLMLTRLVDNSIFTDCWNGLQLIAIDGADALEVSP